MAATNMTHSQFQQHLSNGKPLLVDFWAPWCGYCRRIAPAYDQIADRWSDRITVAKINVDEAPDLAKNYQIDTIPTLMVFRSGKPAGTIVAPESTEAIDRFLQDTLEK